jgi:hypothetical protein
MWSNVFGQGLGQAIAGNSLGQANAYNSYASQAASSAYSSAGLAQAQSIMAQQGSWSAEIVTPWRFNGRYMTFEEFVAAIFPEDSAEKTAFILRHSGEE